MLSQLTSNDLAYIAGLTDGEGSICINEKFVKNRATFGVTVCVTNTNKMILDWLCSSTRLGEVKPKPRNERWKCCYQWILKIEECKPFLEAILPFLRIKRRHAEIVIQFIEETKYHGPHHPITSLELQAKYDLFFELAELNKRGV